MTDGTIVIGIGNRFRRDDGVGPAVSDEIAARAVAGVRVVTTADDPTALLESWGSAARALVIDAAVCEDSMPGRIRRWSVSDLEAMPAVSTHALGLAQTAALGQALGRMPAELVIFTVDTADTRDGVGLTPAVAAAVPKLVEAVMAELTQAADYRM
ncbi:hydrogenase maturation protease [Mycobacterium shimoidei]|uniref:hydrogenase maturation protease n=1 Tax=Mycobacterium shimoidei TaxID=29313 RepID=UPI00084864ED|nr:hydrogenase maturation protease [Mycobacterium shimoidei]MCV7257527.1 hydrogenase maturation protease [Mycobacterium shimoidei]ODR13999.1 peptidase M52 [Mycobacterium shimoidei]ORW82532.1 peptidase M52 [Mycobacterium shimoidei]